MSDEVSNFLRSVEQLKDRRLEEDEARSRELEERIMQEKRERQARRAERARSISPQKSSPANTPPPASSLQRHNNSSNIPPPSSDSLKLQFSSAALSSAHSPSSNVNNDGNGNDNDSHNGNGNGIGASSSPSKENESPFDGESKTVSGLGLGIGSSFSGSGSGSGDSPGAGAAPGPASASGPFGRTPALSWQRRPQSVIGGSGSPSPDRSSRTRPLSVYAAENAAARSSVTPTPALSPEAKEASSANDESPISRDKITEALSGKDPSWFRQTPDRGLNSAAYRRSQVEDEDRQDLTEASSRLPGLSREPSAEPDITPSLAPSHSLALQAASIRSPAPLTPAHKLEPPTRESIVAPPSPSSPGRTSPTRSLSPTKGAGGFVQSAMMKRSDSVKRWSVTSPPGLQRADPATRRLTITSQIGVPPLSPPKPLSRPTSSQGLDANDDRPSTPTRMQSALSSEDRDEPSEPKELKSATATEKEEERKATPPQTPSKTMDSRRWSPTKIPSSWLDAALNKPESAKLKSFPAANSQPAWMQELNKNKVHKSAHPDSAAATAASVAADNIAHTGSVSVRKHEVKTGGLMRSSAMPIGAVSVSAPAPAKGRSATISYHTPSASISSASSKHDDSRDLSREAKVPRELKDESVSDDAPKESKEYHEEPQDSQEAKESKEPKEPKELPKEPKEAKETTPLIKDLRGNLKPRQPLPEKKDSDGNGNELQGVFGTLRRTKTQNYVAPDVLKDNILRGKKSLNLTGGPRPYEKKDELKDAILQKKAEFNQAKSTGRGIATNAHARSQSQDVPEGLIKRLELNKTGGSIRRDSSPTKPGTEVFRRDSSPVKPGIEVFRRGSSPSKPLADIFKRDPSPAKAAEPSVEAPNAFGSLGRNPRIGGLSSTSTGSSGKLADRFNPALAGLLARGPPSAATSPPTDSPSSGGAPVASTGSSSTEPPSGSGPQLTHMTKGRARGPRRKAPSNLQAAKTETSKSEETETPAAPSLETPRKAAAPFTPRKADITVPQVISMASSTKKTAPEPSPKSASARGSPVVSPKPQSLSHKGSWKPAESTERTEVSTPSKSTNVLPLADSSRVVSPILPARSSPKIHEQVAAAAVTKTSPVFKSASLEKIDKNGSNENSTSQPPSPRKIDVKRMSRFLEESANRANVPAPVEVPRPLSPSKTGGARPLPDPRPLSCQKTGGARPLPVPPVSTTSTPLQSKGFDDAFLLPALSSSAVPAPLRSPAKQAQEVSVVLKDFFGSDRPGRSFRVDTAEILSRRPQSESYVRTVTAQLYRVSSDGKKQPVPGHFERVLFEGEMYLCPHTFTDSYSGRESTEVYFWVGDEVPEGMIEDVQVFLNREARTLGGPLVRLQQGKETPEFMAALGGVVTVRRGTSVRFDSLAPAMFCGRRYMGQVAFDEVDFAPSSLCSGFPFLIARQGRCYLWKGKGSNVDELSCARLIGMDLALMGELTEIEDGKESANFWSVFGDGGSKEGPAGKPGSADHWRLKPRYERYAGRLFHSTASHRDQIRELSPFDQRDLSPDGIYVLDAFFEMYIIVGHRSQTQYAAFHNALEFAQEYAILAAGSEDRPFVPISTVVLEGIPRDLKSVFRKWNDAASPTRMVAPSPPAALASPGIKRVRSLRIVPLNVALQALAE